jgi:hypothetical protein
MSTNLISKKSNSILIDINSDYKKLLKAIRKNPCVIKDIDQDPITSKFTQEQIDNLCLAAINNWCHGIYYVKHKTYKICVSAIHQSGKLIEYIDKTILSEEEIKVLYAESIKQNGINIKYVMEKSFDLCKIAVKNNGLALQFIEQDASKISLTQNQIDIICLEAVKNDYRAFEFVLNRCNILNLKK